MRFSIALLPTLITGLIAAPALAEPPQVVADIAPVHALLSQVMEGVATPQLLLEQNADPHAVQLRPSQARMLAGADLLVWVGPELSPWLEGIVETEGTEALALTAHAATHLRAFGAVEEDDHDHADEATAEEADHDHEEGAEDEHGHVHTGVDPHAWLSTENARAWVGLFADTLAARDPENAALYRANADKARAELDALDAEIRARLAAHRGAEIVTFHEAFGYFVDEFGIEVVGSVRPGDASAPSAAAVDALRDLVAEHGVECAFAEPAYDPGLLDAISQGAGLRVGVLDPTGALQPVGPGHYAATLSGIANAIADCLEAG